MKVKELLKLNLEELTALEGRLWNRMGWRQYRMKLMQVMKEGEE